MPQSILPKFRSLVQWDRNLLQNTTNAYDLLDENNQITFRSVARSSLRGSGTLIKKVNGRPANWPNNRAYPYDHHYKVIRYVSQFVYTAYGSNPPSVQQTEEGEIISQPVSPFSVWDCQEYVYKQSVTLSGAPAGSIVLAVRRNQITITKIIDGIVVSSEEIPATPPPPPLNAFSTGALAGVPPEEYAQNPDENTTPLFQFPFETEEEFEERLERVRGNLPLVVPLIDYNSYPPFLDFEFSSGVGASYTYTNQGAIVQTPQVYYLSDNTSNAARLSDLSAEIKIKKSSFIRVYLDSLLNLTINFYGKDWDDPAVETTQSDIIQHDSLVYENPESIDLTNPLPPVDYDFNTDFPEEEEDYEIYYGSVEF